MNSTLIRFFNIFKKRFDKIFGRDKVNSGRMANTKTKRKKQSDATRGQISIDRKILNRLLDEARKAGTTMMMLADNILDRELPKSQVD